MMKEKTPSALRSVTFQLQSFSEPNWIGFKARTIAASVTYSASLKGSFIYSQSMGFSTGDLRSMYRSIMASELFHLVLQSSNR